MLSNSVSQNTPSTPAIPSSSLTVPTPDLESGPMAPCSAAAVNIANAMEHAGSGQLNVQPGNQGMKKKFFCLAGGALGLGGLAAGVTVLVNRLKPGAPANSQPPFTCQKEGDALRTRVFGAQIHLLKDGDSNTVPTSAMMKKMNAAFDPDKGINAIFGDSCDEVLGERIRFTRLSTDVVDATDWRKFGKQPEQTDFTKPYAVSYNVLNAEKYDYKENFLKQADLEKQRMHLFVADRLYMEESATTGLVAGFGEPSDNYQFYSLNSINNHGPGVEKYISSLFAHEFGHNFGLRHVADAANIMYPPANGAVFTPEQCKQIAQSMQSSMSSLADLCEPATVNGTPNSTLLQPTAAPTVRLTQPDIPDEGTR